ncbi:glycosyltransferase family 4 protein [Aquimarina addita]|uniref:Glycosyltransferase family 4 protein n=1 Tax=Aquimarina addita TaxID=870485 RepID=A0ABP7XDR2_9FLAO
MNHILIIGNVWPEPNSSAAGSRMLQLIQFFRSQKWRITFACAAVDSNHMYDIESLGVSRITIQLNHPSFDEFIKQLQPDIVMFDRFMTEEQFGWRVTNHCPQALKILNTEDLHSLRKTRQEIVKSGKEFQIQDLLQSDIAKREIASIYRSDISLMISDFEIRLLNKHIKIDNEQLFYLPFLFDPITSKTTENWPDYNLRNHFITIGNFRHEPNWDSVLYLKTTIWPLIRKQLPDVELHIYGAYPPPKATQLHNPKQGFHIKGWAKDATKVMKEARICLAPLRFGAGIKGKLAEAMCNGTPSITTTIGIEGMCSKESDWNGFVTDDPKKFAENALKLYKNQSIWQQAQQKGIEIINTRFQKEKFNQDLIDCICIIKENLQEHRSKNFIGAMLQHHTLKSTEYMSRWIEEKNK